VKELLTFYGETDGSTVGTDWDDPAVMSLRSDIIRGTIEYFRIPKGMKAKIWCKRISGRGPTDIVIQFTRDVTVASPTWITMDVLSLSSDGELTLEKRKPIIIRSTTGKKAIRVGWYHPDGTAKKTAVAIEVELDG